MRLSLIILSVFLLSFAFSIPTETTTDGVETSCSGIEHCVTCHRGTSYIFYVCDQCDPGYGVDTKYDSSDECIYCDSVIPHCVDCDNKVDAWSCHQCADGYKLIVIPFQDDVCSKEGQEIQKEENGVSFLDE